MLVLPIAALFAILSLFNATAHAEDPIKIISQSSFVDSEGRVNVVGTVRNTGAVPVHVTMGLPVDGRNIQEPTYGRVIWPLNDSPFKFVLESGSAGEPFIMDVREAEATYYGMIVLNYSSMAAGEERAFVGTVKNNAPYDIHNVSVYASVRSDNATQLDTVRSNVIPVLKAGEERQFVAAPDPAVKSKVYYYSCAGLDYDDPITTLDAGDGKFVAYTLSTVAQVSSMKYENATDSISFGIRPYAPGGGDLNLKIPQISDNQTLTVMLDGNVHNASIKGDGKTVHIEFFVPEGEHHVQIQGVRNVPEFPLAMLALAALTAGVIAIARLKAAFKIS